MKICNKCFIEKEFIDFHKSCKSKDGHGVTCKDCSSKIGKLYYLNNRDKVLLRCNNLNKNEDVKKRRREASRKHYLNNKESRKEDVKRRRKERMKTDPLFRLGINLRKRLSKALNRKYKKPDKTISLIGCSWNFLKEYIESKFQPGMTWDNYGKWHLDHIKPLSSFDFSDPNQIREASHYTNFQPLWAHENLVKYNKWAA